MNCEEAIRLIHLDAGEETSAREDDELRAHLLSCERCAGEARLVRQAEPALRHLRASVPVLPQPEDLVQSILAKISKEPSGRRPSRGSLEALLMLTARPAFRFAYAAIVTAFVCLFMLQQADAFRSVEALGEKLARTQPPLVADVRYSMTLEEARGIVGSTELEPFLEATPVSVSSDRISVQKSDIEFWAASFGSRFASKLLESSETPVERLPHLLRDIQKSVTSSLTLRPGGKVQ